MQLRESIEIIVIIVAIVLLYADRQQVDEQSACRDWVAISGRVGP